jgi:hypothetical protein
VSSSRRPAALVENARAAHEIASQSKGLAIFVLCTDLLGVCSVCMGKYKEGKSIYTCVQMSEELLDGK